VEFTASAACTECRECAVLLDSCHNGVVVIGTNGLVTIYNRAARKIFGDGNRRIVGDHFKDVRPEAWPDLKRVLETGQHQIGRKIELPQATIIANRSPIIADGAIVGAISVFQDISEYEKIISELQSYQQVRRELEAIFESSYDGLYITDGNANTLRVNSAYERITGLSAKALIGRNMRDLVQEKVFDYSSTLAVLKERRPVTLVQSVKGQKEVMVTGSPIFDEDGSIAFVVTNVRDMTELNSLRAELADARRISSRMYEYFLEHKGLEHALDKIVVKSPRMVQAIKKAVKVAGTGTSVILYGESGVGKSMLADLIHQVSARKDKPLVRINCGAIPESLIESELFGYDRGAFTGAAQAGKAGLVEAAQTGSLILDEVAELSLAAQVKLLEVIENKTFTRLGSTRATRVDVRIIAATHQNLAQRVDQGLFRRDLYYRLSGVPIEIPPLRERPEDIVPVALNVLAKLNQTHGTHKKMSAEVLDGLQKYAYPGNIRELVHLVERMFTMSERDVIEGGDLPSEVRSSAPALPRVGAGDMTLDRAMNAFEEHIVRDVLKRSSSPQEAARALGIHYSTLWRKLKKFKINLQI
jgi:PAS domain S-box-containing protein